MSTLKETVEAFEKNEKTIKNASLFIKGFKNNKFIESGSLADYIRYVNENPEEWFNKALFNVKMNQRSLQNYKTPLNILLKNEKYAHLLKDVDMAIVKGLPKKFTQTIKSMVKKDDNITSESDTDDDTSEFGDSIKSETDSVLRKEESSRMTMEFEPQKQDTRENPMLKIQEEKLQKEIQQMQTKMEQLTQENNELRMSIQRVQEEKQGVKMLLLDLIDVNEYEHKFYDFVKKIIKKYV